MALRGETIGTAYVRILADGDGFDESVREQFRDSEGGFKQLGRTHSEAYQEGFDEQNEDISVRLIRGLEAGIRRNAGRFDAIGEQIGSDIFDPLDRQFRHRFGDLIGKQMSKDIREAFFRSGGSADVLDDFIEHLEANWEKASRTVDKETAQIERMVREQADRLVEIEDERASETESIRREEFQAAINRINSLVKVQKEDEERRKRAAAEQEKIERRSQAELRKTESEFRRLIVTVEKFHRSVHADRPTRTALIHDMERLGERIRKLGGDTAEFERNYARMRRELITTRPVLTRVSATFDVLSDRMGRAFGRGARNNFLNFVGRFVGFFTSIPGMLTKASQKILNFGSLMQEAFSKGIISGISFLGSSIAQGVAGLVGLAAVLAVAATAAGILSAAIMSLVGALTAMAGSLAFAATFGVAVLAGALVPLIAGIGIATLAIMNMDKETKKAFEGIGKSFKELGKDAAANIFDSAAKDAEAFKKAIEGLRVITGPVSKALGTVLDRFIDHLDSPDLKRFQEFLGRVLPDMVVNIGDIFGNLGKAFQGVFIGITPSVRRFIGWLEELTNKFDKWANSPEGRDEIRQFMNRAAESARAVGDALGEIIGLITDLFDVSKNTGDNLFTDLADTVEGWRESIRQASEDGTLQQWFRDAGETTKAIGRAIEALAQFIEKMDTPENRQLVKDIADAFITLVDVIAEVNRAFRLMGAAFRGAYNGIIGPALKLMLDALATALDLFGSLFDTLGKVPGMGWARRLGEDLHEAADAARATGDAIKEIPKTWDVKINVAVVESNIAHIEERLDRLAHTRNVYYAAVTGDSKAGAAGPSRVAVGTPIGSVGVNVENMTIITPTEDPQAVAAEVVNRFAAAAYA